jgi:replicative DNA helicase
MYDENSKQKGIAEIIIGKQRNGPSGVRVNLAFLNQYTRFENLAGSDDAPPF